MSFNFGLHSASIPSASFRFPPDARPEQSSVTDAVPAFSFGAPRPTSGFSFGAPQPTSGFSFGVLNASTLAFVFQPDGFYLPPTPQLTESSPHVSRYLSYYVTSLFTPTIVPWDHVGDIKIALDSYKTICPHTGLRILRAAAYHGHVDVMQLLIRNFRIAAWADDNIAIRFAVEQGRLEMVKLLLSNPKVDPTACDNECIKTAMKKGYATIVALLIQRPVALNGVLAWAVENNYTDIVRNLLSQQDPSENNNYAIRIASLYGHTQIVALLIADPRVDVAAGNYCAIEYASVRGRVGVLKILCDRVPEPIQIKALVVASKNQQYESVDFWLKKLGPAATQDVYSQISDLLIPIVDKLWITHLNHQ